MLCVCFCFQAEDGIRYLVRSRGLGDVYKRQAYDRFGAPIQVLGIPMLLVGLIGLVVNLASLKLLDGHADESAVSYTHLTLPTSDLV